MSRDPTNPFAPLDNPGWLDKTDITIPPAALEAAKRAYANCEDDANCIEAACLAMLNAWPGMRHTTELFKRTPSREVIILPLTETNNA